MAKKMTVAKKKNLMKDIGKLLRQRNDDEVINIMALDQIDKILDKVISGKLLTEDLEEAKPEVNDFIEPNKNTEHIFRFTPHHDTKMQAKKGVFVHQKGDSQRMDDMRHNG